MKKKAPVPFSQKFPNADPLALRLLERLLAFDHQERPSAEELRFLVKLIYFIGTLLYLKFFSLLNISILETGNSLIFTGLGGSILLRFGKFGP